MEPEAGSASNRSAETFVDIWTSMKAKIRANADVAGLGVLAQANASIEDALGED